MRLFTALWPSDEVIQHLGVAVRDLPPEALAEATTAVRGFRIIPPERWHVTLCFHGDDADRERLADRMDRRFPRLVREHPTPPRLRLAASGSFRGALWVGVRPAERRDADTLRALARAAGADLDGFHAHVTVGRWSRGRPDRRLLAELLARYAGPSWIAGEMALVSSEPADGGPVYRTVHRVTWPAGTAG